MWLSISNSYQQMTLTTLATSLKPQLKKTLISIMAVGVLTTWTHQAILIS